MRPNELCTHLDNGATRAKATGRQRGSFEEGEEISWVLGSDISIASDVVKVKGEVRECGHPSFSKGSQGQVARLRSFRGFVPLARLWGNSGTVSILQYWFNNTKQHTHDRLILMSQPQKQRKKELKHLNSSKTKSTTSLVADVRLFEISYFWKIPPTILGGTEIVENLWFFEGITSPKVWLSLKTIGGMRWCWAVVAIWLIFLWWKAAQSSVKKYISISTNLPVY